MTVKPATQTAAPQPAEPPLEATHMYSPRTYVKAKCGTADWC